MRLQCGIKYGTNVHLICGVYRYLWFVRVDWIGVYGNGSVCAIVILLIGAIG